MTKQFGTSDLIDTFAATGNVVEPSGAKKDLGWELGEQPPHEYMNWVLRILGRTLNYILRAGVPAWNSTTPYTAGDVSKYNGEIYRAVNPSTNSLPTTADWIKIAPFSSRYSIETNAAGYQLVGDASAPGNSKYYGTDGAGARGYYDLPANGFSMGDIKTRFSDEVLTGWVRLNGNTIGSAGSAATERAHADTSTLYAFLWGKLPASSVQGGKGANAAADFAANKRITLPDARNRALVGMDGMGAANTGRLTTAIGGLDGSILGNGGGSQGVTLTVGQLAKHDHPIHSSLRFGRPATGNPDSGVPFQGNPPTTEAPVEIADVKDAGNDEAHPNVQPSLIIGTVYIKL